MCGIAGIATTPGHAPNRAALAIMSEALRHRGPDGEGAYLRRTTALAHRRLAIIGLENGAQPIVRALCALVGNGEIYNDPALREMSVPATFETQSDCEPALVLWSRDGERFAAALRGMYALAISDQNSDDDIVALSRDPFGIKPLYYCETDKGIAFASEAQALLKAGFGTRGVLARQRDCLLQTQFVPGKTTIYPGIKRVLPGETLLIQNGKRVSSTWQPAIDSEVKPHLGESQAIAELDAALMDSVAAHERAEVPFGMFLSGGIDSAAILTAMARLGARRPLAWTARFDRGEVDESAQAQRLAHALGAEHHIVTVSEKMVWDELPQIVAAMDDPVADYAIIPTWFLAREAKRDVKVILSGEGGDELFCGYGRYRRAQRPRWLGGRKPWQRGILDGIETLPTGKHWRDEFVLPTDSSRLRAAQRLDVAQWLANDLLVKLDRCLMAHALEGRTPFLDPEVARVASRLPDHLRVRNGQGKYLLRRWLATHCPTADAFSAKQGFTPPIGEWISEKSAILAPLLAQQSCFEGFFSPRKIHDIFSKAMDRRQRHASWVLLFYALWYRIHIEQISPYGTTFDLLASK